ncbi:MAG: hypothetical protein JNL82_09570 [Myxococcales bacterium]|nr:hypothetical protein [Myxococcales bacterium]
MRAHCSWLLVGAIACGGDDGGNTTTASTGQTAADDGTTAASDPGTAATGDSAAPTTGSSEPTGVTSATSVTSATTMTSATSVSTDPDTSASDPGTGTSGEPDPGETTADPSTTDGGEACVDDHRVVAFIANWQACPSPAQMANWSHAVVAFAVSYTWTPNGNLCDEACAIGEVPGCNGKSLAELAADLHANGVKVLLSFGGAGMGGLWEGTCGQMTKCWDHCIDQTDSLVSALAGLVADNDLDGVDIDYEYCLHDAPHRDFVGDLTAGLRTALDALPGEKKLITHAPMDHELDAGDPYFEIVEAHADAIDFLMPQYYNGGNSPFEPGGLAAIEGNYRALVDGPFKGDASRVAFGYCIEPGCNPVATQPAAVEVATTVEGWYPNNGGVFFWAHPNEADGWFAGPFREHYDQNFCGP